jgi:hypothetical protein
MRKSPKQCGQDTNKQVLHFIVSVASEGERQGVGPQFYMGVARVSMGAFPKIDHRTADRSILISSNTPIFGPKLDLRLNPVEAVKHRRFDAITPSDSDRAALESRSLSSIGNESSIRFNVDPGVAVVVEDGIRIGAACTSETLGPDMNPDEDHTWMYNA